MPLAVDFDMCVADSWWRMDLGQVDRRRRRRYEVCLPMCMLSDGSLTSVAGVVRNMSTGGVLFTIADPVSLEVSPGASIRIGIELTRTPVGLSAMRGIASMVRVERRPDAGKEILIAAILLHSRIVRMRGDHGWDLNGWVLA
jgi:hypothetical protein